MIVAAVGPVASVLADEWRARIDHAVGGSPTYSWTEPGVALFAYEGRPAGRADAPARRVWIGGLRFARSGPRPDYRGDFALAEVLPESQCQLLLARGRFGGRPLYFARAHQGLIACSRLDVLASVLGDPPLSAEGMSAHVVRAPGNDPAETIYRGIQRVPPATALVVDPTGILRRHDLGRDVQAARDGDAESIAEELRALVAQAVTRAMGADRDLGVLVSGGLDSSFVLACALAAGRSGPGTHVHAINLDYADRGDDRSRFRSLCAALGVTPARTTPEECAPLFRQSMVMGGAPATWPTAPFDLRLTQLGRQHGANAVLTGVGGDDLFYGDFRLFADDFRHGHPLRAILRAARLQGYGCSSVGFRLRRFVLSPVLRGLVPPLWLAAIDARRRRPPVLPWAGPRLRRAVVEGLLSDDAPDPKERPEKRSWLCQRMRASYYSFVKETHARIEVAGGCARIDPYFDDDLVEFVASLHPRVLFHDHSVRGIFRHAMRGLVPEDVRTRPDKGRYEAALHGVLEAAGGFDLLRPLSSMVGLADLGIVDPAAFRARFREFEERPRDGRLWMELFPVLAAEAFVRGDPEAT